MSATTSERRPMTTVIAESEERENSQLNGSELTSPIDTGSVSEDEGSGWLGGIGADFRNLAITLKDSIPPSIGQIANFVHESAMSMAAEIATLEELEDDRSGVAAVEKLRLPWEIPSKNLQNTEFSFEQEGSSLETSYIEDEELKQKIFDLSKSKSTFIEPTSPQALTSLLDEDSFFVLDEPRICLIRRLLELDENLAEAQAHMSGRTGVRETVFWKNYFFHCERIREGHVVKDNKDFIPEEQNIKILRKEIESELQINENARPPSPNSLVPAENPSLTDDDDSYICVKKNNIASPPRSLNSWTEV